MQLFISSHQFTCQLVIHPPLLRSSPGFGPANEATTTLRPVELRSSWWFPPQRRRSSVFPYELFLWSPFLWIFLFHPFLLSKIRLCGKFGPTPMNPSWDGQKTPRHIYIYIYIDKRHLSRFPSSFRHIATIHIHIHVIYADKTTP